MKFWLKWPKHLVIQHFPLQRFTPWPTTACILLEVEMDGLGNKIDKKKNGLTKDRRADSRETDKQTGEKTDRQEGRQTTSE